MPVMKTAAQRSVSAMPAGVERNFFALINKVRSPFGVLHADTSFLFLYLFIPINTDYTRKCRKCKGKWLVVFFRQYKIR
ncbi:MAG: hypothetical protein EGR31_06895 [Clostridium sp.]|nr:hypothetical protein [Clostridium sp.]